MQNDQTRIIRNRHEYERQETNPGETTRTQQHFKDETDINLIVKRHAQRGMWDHITPLQPTYGDYSKSVDLQTAIQLVDDSIDEFMALPAEVRKLCDHNPVNMLKNLADPEKARAMQDAGLELGITDLIQDTPAPAPEPAPEPTGGEGGESPSE